MGIIFALSEAVLEDAVDDATDTEGWLDDMRSVLLFLRGACLFREAYHFPGQSVLFLVGGDGDCLSIRDLLSERFLGLLVGCLKELDHSLLILLKRLANDLLVKLLLGLGDRDLFGEAS